jgi:hypothetical protein
MIHATLFSLDIVPLPPRYVENQYIPANVYARAKGYKVNVGLAWLSDPLLL